MTALLRYEKVSEEAFLDYLRSIDGKAEWLDGGIYDMAGGTARHALISSNMSRSVGNALGSKDCNYFSSDLLIRIPGDRSLVFPDGSVICGEIAYEFPREDIVLNPQVVVEVLSPETGDYCQGGKFRKYAKIASLREYLLVSQHAPEVEVRSRHESGLWDIRVHEGMEAAVSLPSLGITITMTEIYRGVIFPTE